MLLGLLLLLLLMMMLGLATPSHALYAPTLRTLKTPPSSSSSSSATMMSITRPLPCPTPHGPLDLIVDAHPTPVRRLDPAGFPCLRRVGSSLLDGFGHFESVRCEREYSATGYGPWRCYPNPPGYVPISKVFEFNVICRPLLSNNNNNNNRKPPSSGLSGITGSARDDAAYTHLSCSVLFAVEWSSQWVWAMAVFVGTCIVAWCLSLYLLINYGSITTAALCCLYVLMSTAISVISVSFVWLRDDISSHMLAVFITTDVVAFFLTSTIVSWLAAYDHRNRLWRLYHGGGLGKKHDDAYVAAEWDRGSYADASTARRNYQPRPWHRNAGDEVAHIVDSLVEALLQAALVLLCCRSCRRRRDRADDYDDDDDDGSMRWAHAHGLTVPYGQHHPVDEGEFGAAADDDDDHHHHHHHELLDLEGGQVEDDRPPSPPQENPEQHTVNNIDDDDDDDDTPPPSQLAHDTLHVD